MSVFVSIHTSIPLKLLLMAQVKWVYKKEKEKTDLCWNDKNAIFIFIFTHSICCVSLILLLFKFPAFNHKLKVINFVFGDSIWLWQSYIFTHFFAPLPPPPPVFLYPFHVVINRIPHYFFACQGLSVSTRSLPQNGPSLLPLLSSKTANVWCICPPNADPAFL